MATRKTERLKALQLEWDEKGHSMSDEDRKALLVEIMGADWMKVGELKRVQAAINGDDSGQSRYLWDLLLEIAAEEESLSDWLRKHPEMTLRRRVEVAGEPSENLIEQNLETLKAYLVHRGPAAFHSWRFRAYLERECGYLDKVVRIETTQGALTAKRRAWKKSFAADQKVRFDHRKKLIRLADKASAGLTDPVKIRARLQEVRLFQACGSWESIPELIAWGRQPRRGRSNLPVQTIAMASMILAECSPADRPSVAELEQLAKKRIRKMLGDMRERP